MDCGPALVDFKLDIPGSGRERTEVKNESHIKTKEAAFPEMRIRFRHVCLIIGTSRAFSANQVLIRQPDKWSSRPRGLISRLKFGMPSEFQ